MVQRPKPPRPKSEVIHTGSDQGQGADAADKLRRHKKAVVEANSRGHELGEMGRALLAAGVIPNVSRPVPSSESAQGPAPEPEVVPKKRGRPAEFKGVKAKWAVPDEKPQAKRVKRKKPPSAREQGHRIAESVISSFVDRMRAEAENKGGALTLRDLDILRVEFESQINDLTNVFERSFEVFVKARERAANADDRAYPYDQVMVDTFGYLFDEDEKLDSVSRRMLPGFYLALNMMLGHDMVEAHQATCRTVVSNLVDVTGVVDWDAVYQTPEVRQALLESLIAIAGHFEDFEKRCAWLEHLINGHLARAGDGAPENVLNWQISKRGVRKFLRALFGELTLELATDHGRSAIESRHGTSVLAGLLIFMEELQA